jgi:hypothetical protein
MHALHCFLHVGRQAAALHLNMTVATIRSEAEGFIGLQSFSIRIRHGNTRTNSHSS